MQQNQDSHEGIILQTAGETRRHILHIKILSFQVALAIDLLQQRSISYDFTDESIFRSLSLGFFLKGGEYRNT